jgi:hypothetical protein
MSTGSVHAVATLCVEVTEGGMRSYVSVSGKVSVRRPPEAADLHALDTKYSRDDYAEGWDDEASATAVMIKISPQRCIAWTDWD